MGALNKKTEECVSCSSSAYLGAASQAVTWCSEAVGRDPTGLARWNTVFSHCWVSQGVFYLDLNNAVCRTPTSWYSLNHKESFSQSSSFYPHVRIVPECPSLVWGNKDSLAQGHQIHTEKRHPPATQFWKKMKRTTTKEKKKINKSFGSTRGKNLQLEIAFVLLLKHGITVISQL